LLLHALSGKTCSLCYWDCFFLQPIREDVWFTHIIGGYAQFIGTCSCVRRQVLVANVKRWEPSSWEVVGYLSAHVCSWLWTYHPEGWVDTVYLLAWSFIGTCSCVRRQVLVPNAKRWETSSWEVVGYLSAHVCSWLWTYHPEGE